MLGFESVELLEEFWRQNHTKAYPQLTSPNREEIPSLISNYAILSMKIPEMTHAQISHQHLIFQQE